MLFALFSAFTIDSSATPAETTEIQILYTGAIRGELEPCGCSPKTQSGGLARLSGYIRAHDKELRPYVMLDAGGQLSDDTAQGRLKSEALAKAFDKIGYGAIALFGTNASEDAKRFPKGSKGALLYGGAKKNSVNLKRASVRINISVEPKSRKANHLNILLTDKPVDEAVKITDWDIVVSSSGETLDEPIIKGSSVITAGYPKGQKLGVLKIQVSPMGRIISHSHVWKTLGDDVAEDKEVRLIIEDYEKKVAKLADSAPKPPTKNSAYIGETACSECHPSYNDGWRLTRHASAFDTLVKAGRDKNPECVQCHTTGYNDEGGFYSEASTPGLKGVQCEACHGPAKDHSSSFGPMAPVDESSCARCHTKDRSPEFNYSTYFERIKHGGI